MKMETDIVTEHEVQIRPMLCKLNAHSRSDGSALFTQGKRMLIFFLLIRHQAFDILNVCFSGETAVTATVLGPVEVKMHNLHIDKAYVEVYYRCKTGLPTVADRLREKIIRNTCETSLLTVLYPRSAITLQIHEMEDCGGVSIHCAATTTLILFASILIPLFFLKLEFQLIACAVNAVCLALLNSGLSMKMLIAGVHCVINCDGDLIIDPDREQAENALASLTFVFDSVDKNIVAEHTTGKFTIGQYNDALVQCQQASNAIFQFYRNALTKFHKLPETDS